MNTNRIGIIGTGRLGLSFALLCEQSGYQVMGSDMNSTYVHRLNDKAHRTIEPHINDLLLDATRFTSTISNKEVVEFADIIFVFVPTPSLATGKYQHTFIEQVIDDMEKFYEQGVYTEGKILVIGCTVMPGFTRSIQDRIQAIGMDVVYNPEFIAQGSIIDNLKTADMILIGTDDERAYHSLQGIYRTIMTKEPVFNKMTSTAAEITKIAINCFIALKISYANMIGDIAAESGVGGEKQVILDAVGDDSRIGRKLTRYGYGYGGPCIPRDGRALGVHADEVGIKAGLCQTADTANTLHASYLRDYYIRQNPHKDFPFLFTQLTYKKGVDMLTESQQYRLCRDLLEAGYKVDIRESAAITTIVQEELSHHLDRITWGTVAEGYTIDI